MSYHSRGMLILGIDTSDLIGGVSLFEKNGVAVEKSMDAPLRHAENLLPLVEAILDENHRTKEDIERVSVHRGPGSFTGLRIGLAAAKGFCQARGIPLVGVDGMVAARWRLSDAHRVCVVMTSRRDLVYAQRFTGDEAREPVRICRADELAAELLEEQREMVLVGSGAAKLAESVRVNELIRIAPEAYNRGSPLTIARLGSEPEREDQLYELEPCYVESVLA